MNILDQLKQNLVVAIVIVVAIAIGVAWKVFRSLYVLPRDFKINSLKDDMKRLQEELIGLRREQERQAPVKLASEPAGKTLESENPKAGTSKTSLVTSLQIDAASGSPLSSLSVCYAMWSDENLTKLQKQKFEADYVGKQVSWTVRVESVSEAEYETIFLYVSEPTTHWDRARAAAEFSATEQDVLLGLKKGDRIGLRGTIKDFFLWPRLTNCRIEKINDA